MTPDPTAAPQTDSLTGDTVNDQLRQMAMNCGRLAQQAPELQQLLQQAASIFAQAQMQYMSSQRDNQQDQQPVVAA